MRSLLALGLVVLTAAVLPAAGGDERTDQQQAIVNITPRTKGQNSGRETVIVPKAIIRIDTTLVSIPAVVTDPLSRFMTGLDKEHFSLHEDKVEQQIIHLSSEDTPLSIGIVFDTSGSMGAKLSRSRQAASQFLKTANPEDEFFLVEFNDRPDLVVGFTPNVEDRFESVDVSSCG
jgi:Ca-activated chloride channel homolog